MPCYRKSKGIITNERTIMAFKVTPWEVSGKVDYEKLRREFGAELIDEKIKNKIEKNSEVGIIGTHYDSYINDCSVKNSKVGSFVNYRGNKIPT